MNSLFKEQLFHGKLLGFTLEATTKVKSYINSVYAACVSACLLIIFLVETHFVVNNIHDLASYSASLVPLVNGLVAVFRLRLISYRKRSVRELVSRLKRLTKKGNKIHRIIEKF